MKPVIVLTGTTEEFERYCMENGRDRKTAIQITHPAQFQHYPGLDVVLYGNYHINNAYNSQLYKDYEYDTALEESKKFIEDEAKRKSS